MQFADNTTFILFDFEEVLFQIKPECEFFDLSHHQCSHISPFFPFLFMLLYNFLFFDDMCIGYVDQNLICM